MSQEGARGLVGSTHQQLERSYDNTALLPTLVAMLKKYGDWCCRVDEILPVHNFYHLKSLVAEHLLEI